METLEVNNTYEYIRFVCYTCKETRLRLKIADPSSKSCVPFIGVGQVEHGSLMNCTRRSYACSIVPASTVAVPVRCCTDGDPLRLVRSGLEPKLAETETVWLALKSAKRPFSDGEAIAVDIFLFSYRSSVRFQETFPTV
jgi:hypothetical protein